MMALSGVEAASHLAQTAHVREPQLQRHGRLALEKPSLNWNAQDRYVGIPELWVKVMKILETKAYGFTDKDIAIQNIPEKKP